MRVKRRPRRGFCAFTATLMLGVFSVPVTAGALPTPRSLAPSDAADHEGPADPEKVAPAPSSALASLPAAAAESSYHTLFFPQLQRVPPTRRFKRSTLLQVGSTLEDRSEILLRVQLKSKNLLCLEYRF